MAKVRPIYKRRAQRRGKVRRRMHSAAAVPPQKKSRFSIVPPEQALNAARLGLPLGAAEMCALYRLSSTRFYARERAGRWDHLRLPNSAGDGDDQRKRGPKLIRRRYSGVKVYRELTSEEPILHGRRPVPRRGLKAAEKHK